jgi:hypothetical protein
MASMGRTLYRHLLLPAVFLVGLVILFSCQDSPGPSGMSCKLDVPCNALAGECGPESVPCDSIRVELGCTGVYSYLEDNPTPHMLTRVCVLYGCETCADLEEF